ncbi:MAG: hypothetical protein H7256_00045 [Bdellovibrio sp.]|nr:hypothetical protein [Bdellovibrio sp.]
MNKKILVASLFVFSAVYSFGVQADDLCVSGNASSTSLIDQLNKAKTSNKLTQIIYQKYNLGAKQEATAQPVCTDCSSTAMKIPETIKTAQSSALHSPEPPTLAFKQECLVVSNTSSSASAAQIACPSGTRAKGNMCITNEQLTYQNAVISNFVNCAVKEGLTGIDLNAIFQKLSIESGFRPQYSSGNGTGMGQLTSTFIDDIHQKHRGYKYMKKIADSTNPDCDAAKLIASPDLKSKPKFSNKCEFISTGEGFERNILYSLIGTTTVWEMNLEPKLRPYLKKHASDSNIDDVKQLSVMNAYGSGGPAAAAAAIRRLSARSPAEFVKGMKKPLKTMSGKNLTQYTSNIEKRQNKIGDKLPEPIKSEFAKVGADACINPF